MRELDFFFLLAGFQGFSCNQDTQGNFRLPGGKQRTTGKCHAVGADHIYIYVTPLSCGTEIEISGSKSFGAYCEPRYTLSSLRFSPVAASGKELTAFSACCSHVASSSRLLTRSAKAGSPPASLHVHIQTHTCVASSDKHLLIPQVRGLILIYI